MKPSGPGLYFVVSLFSKLVLILASLFFPTACLQSIVQDSGVGAEVEGNYPIRQHQNWPAGREEDMRDGTRSKYSWTEEPGGLQSMGSQSQTRLSN